MVSPIFRDLFSLPQPSDDESVNGLPVVQLTEDAELLNSLASMLYPVHPVIPNSYDKVLYLLSACQKYEMDQVQSLIRSEVNHGTFPTPFGTEVFRAYAIASSKGLVQEMETIAHRTLDYPMTLEALGEMLQFFEGWALRDLVYFRKRRRDNLVTCLESFSKDNGSGPSKIWIGCHRGYAFPVGICPLSSLPGWLDQVLSRNIDNLKSQLFTHPLATPSRIREEYTMALQRHNNCDFCARVHMTDGLTFGAELENSLARARDDPPFVFKGSENSPSRPE
jgi:hypothetical protein